MPPVLTHADARRIKNDSVANVARAFTNPVRLELLRILCQGEASVTALAVKTGQSPANASAQLKVLLAAGRLRAGSRLAIVSSIWQLESRPGKFSYTVSKAALQGLVKSCALDLGPSGILINAVLPGVVDTPMTRSHLSAEQIAAITAQSALGRLPEPADIASAVAFLVSQVNRSITGQFLTVDGGFIGLKHA
jgi:NAD(P)-dependent dehydrogenase (short-subunit alcohol dehydrogenase family)